MIMKLEVPKRHVLKPTLSIVMVQWVLQWGEAKEVLSLQMSKDQGRRMPFYFLFLLTKGFHSYKERREEEGEMVKHEKKIPKIALFGHIFKNQHIHLWVHGDFSWSTSSFTPSQGPTFFKIAFSRNRTMKVLS